MRRQILRRGSVADFAKLTAAVAEDPYATGEELEAVNNAWKTVGVL
ncbi:hypothetical protein [Streptomyces sp. NPDC018352]